MEFIIIIGLFAVILILFSIKGSLEKEIRSLSYKLDKLKTDIQELKKETNSKKTQEPAATPQETVRRDSITPPVIMKQEPVKVPAPVNVIKSPVTVLPKPKPAERKPSFFERNPDLEKFIGENLINKIGIAILVLGIGFFVKYAIDQEWINETGRVFIGILCGGILVAFAHKTRKSFKAFSSVLVGGGMAVFYFTIAIAFHEYEMFSPPVAFMIMVVITAFSVLLAIAYDRVELAVLAIVGGFASPFMVSTGEGNYIVLFTYTLLLNSGMLVLAYFKKWNIVNIVSYAFTILLYGGWLITKVQGNPEAPLAGAFVFATLFYLVFFVMNIINNIKEKRKFIVTEISILLSITFLYYSAGMLILKEVNDGEFQGLFTAFIAVFNFTFAFTLYKNKKVDLNLVYLLIGLVLTFLSLAAPVQLEGNYITLFWASEAVLLLWLSQKSGIHLIRLGSVLVTALMCISLVMDWFILYEHPEALTVIFNKGFITGTVALTSLFASISLLKKEGEILIYKLPTKIYSSLLKTIFLTFLYITPLLELTGQLPKYIAYESVRSVIIGSYNLAFIAALMIYTNKKGTLIQKKAAAVLGVAGVLAFLFYYSPAVAETRDQYLQHGSTILSYLYHYADSILTVFILILTLRTVSNIFTLRSGIGKAFLWFMTFASVYIASAELDHLVVLSAYQEGTYIYDITSENQRIGYPILWGLCSFIVMIIGMNKKVKDLRIISLSLFFLTILKLFLFDIRDISEGGKIAAFICLGILLLIMSFMYQKLKKLVLEDESKNTL